MQMMQARNALAEVLHSAAEVLRRKGFTTPRLDAEILLSHQMGMARTGLYVHFRKSLSRDEIEGFLGLIERRIHGEPIAYITGRKEFWSLLFEVGPDVLIPRPDTEVLVEEVLRAAKDLGRDDPDILEIGTGSGAVGIALAKELRNARIVATDVSGKALHLAKKNAAAHAVADKIHFLHGNLFEPLSANFDIIASNPPYLSEETFRNLPPGVRMYEPKEALMAGPKGTEFHEALIKGSRDYLRDGGWLLMEMGEGQKAGIEVMLNETALYEEIKFAADYAGLPRVAGARRKIS
jgi:release factor glutamine methyltransferase